MELYCLVQETYFPQNIYTDLFKISANKWQKLTGWTVLKSLFSQALISDLDYNNASIQHFSIWKRAIFQFIDFFCTDGIIITGNRVIVSQVR